MVGLPPCFHFNDQDDKNAASKRWKRPIYITEPCKDETQFLGDIERNIEIKVPTVIKIEIIYISTTSDRNKATRQ